MICSNGDSDCGGWGGWGGVGAGGREGGACDAVVTYLDDESVLLGVPQLPPLAHSRGDVRAVQVSGHEAGQGAQERPHSASFLGGEVLQRGLWVCAGVVVRGEMEGGERGGNALAKHETRGAWGAQASVPWWCQGNCCLGRVRSQKGKEAFGDVRYPPTSKRTDERLSLGTKSLPCVSICFLFLWFSKSLNLLAPSLVLSIDIHPVCL